jgi:hypothetical protein
MFESATAQTEIHKCADADGGIVYSQLPCEPQEPVLPEKTEPEPKVETTPPEATQEILPLTEVAQETPESIADSSACKKLYRDGIDAIDAEIGREYTPEKADLYKLRLLVLTRKLRQC